MAWERHRRDFVERKYVDLEHLRSRDRMSAVDDAASIGNSDHARRGRFRDVVDADQSRHLDMHTDLFQTLARCCGRGILVVVDKYAP
jgi:hypothetical protein